MIRIEDLETWAREAGLDFVAARPAAPAPEAARFRDWLDAGRHAGLSWMVRTADARADPRVYRPGTKTVILAGVSYGAEDPPPAVWNDPARGRIARFAWGPDYHRVMDGRLAELARRIEAVLPGDRLPLRFVDSRPVLERAWAAAAGAGGIGRNSLWLHRSKGSYVLLGGLLLDLEVPGSAFESSPDPCVECHACRAACPAEALDSISRSVDCRKCLSYWTVEFGGCLSSRVIARMDRRIFGCDACQEACPRNRSRIRAESGCFLRFEADRDAPLLEDLLALDSGGFLDRYSGTPVERAGLSRLRRNAVAVLAASGLPGAGDLIRERVRDPDPLIRAQAGQILPAMERARGDRAARTGGGPPVSSHDEA